MSVTVKQAARLMNVSERSVYHAIELQRCSPSLADQVAAGAMTIREALGIAKPEKYGKRDKVEQWLAAFTAWSREDQDRAIVALAGRLANRPGGHQ